VGDEPTTDQAASLDEQVRCAIAEGICRITLHRPDAHNALTPDQRNRIIELLESASADLHVRVVMIDAVGKAFCSGADLRVQHEQPPRPDDAPERAQGEIARLIQHGAQRLVAAVLDCEKPVLAVVQGTAAGIGAHLALACDLVVMSEDAKLVEVFVRRGLVPDGGGAYLLPRLVGVAKAKELLFFGDDVPAAEAERLGLVNRVVPAGELVAFADAWARRLAAAPTRSIALSKRLVNRSLESDRTTAFAEEAAAQELNMSTADAQEGVRSFVERRDPVYRGW
jgi:2-(1,2-epoxy-1,2-dihydrophenyl)acetyl-CoA isomerase